MLLNVQTSTTFAISATAGPLVLPLHVVHSCMFRLTSSSSAWHNTVHIAQGRSGAARRPTFILVQGTCIGFLTSSTENYGFMLF